MHVDEVYGAKVSQDTISWITEKVAGEFVGWVSCLLERVYLVIFVDAVVGVGS